MPKYIPANTPSKENIMVNNLLPFENRSSNLTPINTITRITASIEKPSPVYLINPLDGLFGNLLF